MWRRLSVHSATTQAEDETRDKRMQAPVIKQSYWILALPEESLPS